VFITVGAPKGRTLDPCPQTKGASKQVKEQLASKSESPPRQKSYAQ